jgi:diadenosine tetraphosphatase ApaH/serine/threonine PP2A family protein phosphatase
MLGEERIAWLAGLPRLQMHGPMALVHGTPESPWKAPGIEATDGALEAAYGPLNRPVAVYGHIHRGFIRKVRNADGTKRLVANSGSVSLSYDGDYRASYLLLDGSPSIRRVEYDVERELTALASSGLPHADWIARTLRSASPQMP